MSKGKAIGRMPVAGLELVENKHCRLATLKQDVAEDIVLYNDFKFVVMGNWNYGAAKYKVYPLVSGSTKSETTSLQRYPIIVKVP